MPSSKIIAFYSSDPGNHRFINPIIDALQLRGYTCRLYNNWAIDAEADTLWFDFCDNNLIVASNENTEHLKSKKVIARLHAVEAYMGFYRSIKWEAVNHLIFVSDHLREKCSDIPYPDTLKIHVIHNGIDLARMTYRERTRDSSKYLAEWNFGYVGNIVPQKGLLTFLHYFSFVRKEWPDAKLYLAGLSRMQGREGEYWAYMKAKIGNIFEEGPIENTDQWLDDKKILWLVQPSYAESFSIIIGEAMAKGIKPLINDFQGSRGLWPEELIYTNIQEFCGILEAPYQSRMYRQWVEDRYSLADQINKVEALLL